MKKNLKFFQDCASDIIVFSKNLYIVLKSNKAVVDPKTSDSVSEWCNLVLLALDSGSILQFRSSIYNAL